MGEDNENVSEGYYEYARALKNKERSTFLGPRGWREKIEHEINEAEKLGDEAKAIEQARSRGTGWNDIPKSMRYAQIARELALKKEKLRKY
jgi:hypothetical protein